MAAVQAAQNTGSEQPPAATTTTTTTSSSLNKNNHATAVSNLKNDGSNMSNVSKIASSVNETSSTSNIKNNNDDDDDEVKEFTVSGNRLKPLTSQFLTSNTLSSFDNKTTSQYQDDDDEEEDDDDDEDYDEDDDDDDYDDDDDDHVIGTCLHCNLPPPPPLIASSSSTTNNIDNTTTTTTTGPTAPGIQVSCDDCHSFICSACHWCHEYQANHEIRVCDRCDAFYCKGCDEMDQCEDCGEVVCAGCGALCSCKFCGCGLCEDCATACGRCGIVLCARDAKFAVECDTCKMSYCLVCLASGTKDPCVRCGHRTSKRVEQLVHLRLKSIYKAFKQSGAALNNNNNTGSSTSNNTTTNNDGGNNTNDNTATTTHDNKSKRSDSDKGDNHGKNFASSPRVNVPNAVPSNFPPDDFPNTHSMPTWMAKKVKGGGPSISMPLPASVARYAEMHAKDLKKRPGGGIASSSIPGRQNCSSLNGDVVLQVAVAAASASASMNINTCSGKQTMKGEIEFHTGGKVGGASKLRRMTEDLHFCRDGMKSKSFRSHDDGHSSHHHTMGGSQNPNVSTKNSKISSSGSDQFASRTQAEADAAAAALLAELDEERLLSEANNQAKKDKKKKKKERQLAAKEKEKEEIKAREETSSNNKKANYSGPSNTADESHLQVEDNEMKDNDSSGEAEINNDEIQTSSDPSGKKKKKKKKSKKTKTDDKVVMSNPSPSDEPEIFDEDNESLNDENIRNSPSITSLSTSDGKGEQGDDVEKRLSDLVADNDLEGVEELLSELKGIPGRAALRKNAKKAVKRMKEEIAAAEMALEEADESSNYQNPSNMAKRSANPPTDNAENTSGYKPNEPLLKVVSSVHRVQGNNALPAGSNVPRSECVLHMAPIVVGWVIGKGGQRIRDLMEESGSKVWIDQDSMGPKEMRIVYISGSRNSVETAVKMIKELVAKAPIGGANITTHVNNNAANDASSITSTRSSLTSTPVSFFQNLSQQNTAEKQSVSPIKSLPNTNTNATPASALSISPEGKDHLPASSLIPPPVALNTMNSPPRTNNVPDLMMPPPPPGIIFNPGTPTKSPKQNNSTKVVHELSCEPRFVPLLIGRRGWTVKNIQDTSGARVDIDQTVTPRRIIVSGEVPQVKEAVRLVLEVLSYPHAQLHYNTEGRSSDDMDDDSIEGDHALNLILSSRGLDSYEGQHEIPIPSQNNSVLGLQNSIPMGSTLPYPHQSFLQPQGIELFTHQGNQQDFESQRNSFPQSIRSQQMQQNNAFDVSSAINIKPSLQAQHPSFASAPVASNMARFSPPAHHESISSLGFDRSSNYSDNLGLNRSASLPQPQVHDYPHRHSHQINNPTFGDPNDFDLNKMLPKTTEDLRQKKSVQAGYGDKRSEMPPAFMGPFPPAPSTQNDSEIIANLFGLTSHNPPSSQGESESFVDGSFFAGFNSMNLGGSGDLGLGNTDWQWDSLLGSNIEDKSPAKRSVGLGGVRLDWSSDIPSSMNTNSADYGKWGSSSNQE